MSLTTQPAARMKKDPAAKRTIIFGSGKHPAGVANPMLHVHGQKSNHVPVKMLDKL